ncbi:MAG: hypothetical protein EOO61_01845 [Hymenobacter sp.]|nr:MAG: hypothetical protein EOO61_01845 [Hymenobacter sp.]
MEHNTHMENNLSHPHSMLQAESLIMEAKKAPSALLARLIQEVKTEAQSNVLAYNRTHNRHNRGR